MKQYKTSKSVRGDGVSDLTTVIPGPAVNNLTNGGSRPLIKILDNWYLVLTASMSTAGSVLDTAVINRDDNATPAIEGVWYTGVIDNQLLLFFNIGLDADKVTLGSNALTLVLRCVGSGGEHGYTIVRSFTVT